MRLAQLSQLFFVALFALLQGVAPLLHAHVAEGPHNGRGVHSQDIGPPVAPGDAQVFGAHGAVTETQTPFVELGEQLRRQLTEAIALPPSLPQAAARAQVEWRIGRPATTQAAAPTSLAHLLPPAQGPPAQT